MLSGYDSFLGSFPEDLYPPSPSASSDYHQRVLYGLDFISRKTVKIGFLARNIESNGKYLIRRIKKLSSLFKDSKIFSFENDSTDNTKVILNQIDGVHTSENLNLPYETDKSKARCIRMAYCRNKLASIITADDFKSDYVIILDSDIEGGYSYEGIANSFSYEWDVCASNSIIYDIFDGKHRRLYYDSWAWRDLNHPQPHLDDDINVRHYYRGEVPIEVLSAFGGLAIYKSECYGIFPYLDDDCDHVTIHKKLHAIGKKIVMNPSQITIYNKTRYCQ